MIFNKRKSEWIEENIQMDGELLELWGYQKRALEDDSRFKVYKWGRRTGKTLLGVLETLYYCYNPEHFDGNQILVIFPHSGLRTHFFDHFSIFS